MALRSAGAWAVVSSMFVVLLFAVSCGDDEYDLDDQFDDSLAKVRTDMSFFRDAHGRYVYLNGVNLSGSNKVPTEFDPVSYIGKPFRLDEADHHLRMLQKLGFNSVRLLVMWEGIEHEGRGIYDEEYLDYMEKVVAKANEYGIYVMLDMHQDMFSRHLFTFFDDGTEASGLFDPVEAERAAPYGYNNRVGGDGAPKWVVETCLPEKFVGGPEWGLPVNVASHPRNTSDVLPWTSWFLNMGLSLDINRCFAAFFAGDAVWPTYSIDGINVKDYLQEAYADAYAQVAMRVKDYPNVLGYETMNEPGGVYILLTLYALIYQDAGKLGVDTFDPDRSEEILDDYLDQLVEKGISREALELWREEILVNDLLPTSVDEMNERGFGPKVAGSAPSPDFAAALALNSNFNRNYLQPFHERVGHRLLEEDADAIIFFEEVLGLPDKGIAGQWAEPMTAPEGIEQYAFVPHKYVDIYPNIGFGQPPRDFTVEERRHRDYLPDMEAAFDTATFSLGNPPAFMGEFGVYYNFGGIEKSMANDYIVSSYILDPYYEAFEKMLVGRMLWCYSPENTAENGEGWNKEDFSILGPDGQPRSWQAYSRTVPRATSGRIQSMHFYSPMHYFEPREGEQTPWLEFEMEMSSKETDAPTEIFVPPMQYADGFYVWLSDGHAAYDPHRFILYWYPAKDDPAWTHTIRIRPPYPNSTAEGWDYLFRGDEVIEGGER
ncbi:MAG: cellulase family glycosylhydrolase [Deltaproteobacteria bacterium]|nr:cellulase family glycosylhydrolase [Deltaproteobacteria bacterium]